MAYIRIEFYADIRNKGELAQPVVSEKSLMKLPNTEYAGSLAMSVFLVYALFVYRGTEADRGKS